MTSLIRTKHKLYYSNSDFNFCYLLTFVNIIPNVRDLGFEGTCMERAAGRTG